jgi:hypothetical protein
LIQAISKGIGTGLISETDIPVEFTAVHPKKTPTDLHTPNVDWRRFLLLNIKAKPSTLFVQQKPEGDDPEDPPADDADFSWHCKEGLAANI